MQVLRTLCQMTRQPLMKQFRDNRNQRKIRVKVHIKIQQLVDVPSLENLIQRTHLCVIW